MARNDDHTYSADVRVDKRGQHFVRIIDRYWPGGPNPEYSGVLDLDPHEAIALGRELEAAALRAQQKQKAAQVNSQIRANTDKIAADAKADAFQ
jgi:hypothetical protein